VVATMAVNSPLGLAVILSLWVKLRSVSALKQA